MVTVAHLKFVNIPQLKTYNSRLTVYVILAFIILVTSQHVFQNELFVYALQPRLIPPPTTTPIDQSQPSIQITAGKVQNLSFRIDLSNRQLRNSKLPTKYN